MKVDVNVLQRPSVTRLFELFASCGFQLYVVGGCIRDTMLGLPFRDVDLATDATPKETIELADSANLVTSTAGAWFGTIEFRIGGDNLSVTTFRKEISTDGRWPEVEFGTTLNSDARRRDFTINAIYAGRNGTLIDPVGGVPDLHHRVLRFIGNPDRRIREDYLRAIRLFRLAAILCPSRFEIEKRGLVAVRNCDRSGLHRLSDYRIRNELQHILTAPQASRIMDVMARAGVLDVVLPGADPSHLPRLDALEMDNGIKPDLVRRIALLGGSRVGARLQLRRAEAQTLRRIDDAWKSASTVEEIAFRNDAHLALSVGLLRAASTGLDLPLDLVARCEWAEQQEFPVRASDLDADYHGRRIGLALKDMQRRWIDSGFRASRSELLNDAVQN